MDNQMLLSILRMPVECWGDSVLEKAQRFGRYNEAAYLIDQITDEIKQLRSERDRLQNELKTAACLISTMKDERDTLQAKIDDGVRISVWKGKPYLIGSGSQPANATVIMDDEQ